MTDTITIPPEALEAAKKIIKDSFFANETYAEYVARAACLAMLTAWPGMRVSMLFPPDVLHVVLPLTKEGA